MTIATRPAIGFTSPSGEAETIRRMAAAIAVGSVGWHSSPTPVALTTPAMPGRSEATTGVPAAIASNSFWGVVNR
jgi:hypothetical protein